MIDSDGQCLVYSIDNYGCTGYSEAFAVLDGDDCSGWSWLSPKHTSALIVNDLQLSVKLLTGHATTSQR